MMEKNKKDGGATAVGNRGTAPEKNDLPGNPVYPSSEDIYSNDKNETGINTDNIATTTVPGKNDITGANNEKDFEEDLSGSDLDIPGSELDDAEENIGSEDEENNHYSAGGDDHNDLEEDNGE